MTTTTSTFSLALEYVRNHAGNTELEVIFDAASARREELQQIEAAKLTVGATVTIDGVSPKYLNGLSGTIDSLHGSRAGVMLDAASTARLRSASKRYYVPTDVDQFLLSGIPKVCCAVTE